MTRMRLTYDNNVVDPGVVTNYSESFQKSVTTFPIVTKSTDDTMAVESGSGRELSTTFERIHPRNHDNSSSDPSDWSNAKWYRSIQDAVDRWQTRTDGFIVDVIPEDDNPYVPKRMGLNGYVSSVTLSYKAGDNTHIVGRMGIATGRMWVQNKQPDPIEGVKGDESLRKNHTVLMSAPLNSNGDESWYLLYSFEDYIDCISSYTITGGPECPFEVLEMTLPKKSLELVAPDLVDNIITGKSRIMVDAIGKGSYTVSKCKLSGKNYRITAYCDAAVLTGFKLEQDATLTPEGWISMILMEGRYGVAFKGSAYRYAFNPRPTVNNMLRFTKGTNIWYILQVCALYLGCKICFSADKVYLADMREDYKGTTLYSTPYPVSDYESINLYDRDPSSPYYAKMYGSPTLGDEGSDVIINTVAVTCGTGKTDKTTKKAVTDTFTFTDDPSVKAFQEYLYSVTLNNLIQDSESGYNQAETFARSIMDYRREPQQSVTFTFKEMYRDKEGVKWQSTFPPMCRTSMIYSTEDGFVVSNKSVLTENMTSPQKLMLSTYTRNYPQGTTTYTFGQISGVDLTSSTASLDSAVKG